MPLFYILLHLSLAWLLCRDLASRGRSRRYKNALAIGTIVLAVVAMVVERSPVLAWSAMNVGIRDLVFLTNLTVEAAAVIATALWLNADDRPARRRAMLLGVALFSSAALSYKWYFDPLPPVLSGAIDDEGYCKQTTEDSCSAAAAVMLLYNAGIRTDEREMADLCLTRRGFGTHPLGMYRGVWLKSEGHGLRPKLVQLDRPEQLAKLGKWAVISVGVRRGSSPEVVQKMEQYGWSIGQFHSVVIQGGAPDGSWLQVADPSYGSERWPIGDMMDIWNGQALVLRPQ